MATATVLRVKRRLEDNPQDALVLMCKRMKTDIEEISPSLFVFRGTVDNQETTNVTDIVPKTVKLKSAKINDIIEKIRQERKDKSIENRYEVINCSRGLKSDTEENVVDLVALQQNCEAESQDVQYAYDLYTAPKQDFDISMIDDLVGIENYDTDLPFGPYREHGPSGDEADDDDDSNDENNWRNEYPDSEQSSIDEEDMARAMQRVAIEDDLSSDTGEDKIYDSPPDFFNDDANRYGSAYAQYKARVLGELPGLSDSKKFVHCTFVKDLDEESVEGYKEDSDDDFYYGREEDTDQYREQYGNASSDEYSPD